jgi:TP901 family phage tail tape measure protein
MVYTTRWQLMLQDLLSPGLRSAGTAGDKVTKSIQQLRREAASLSRMRIGVTSVRDLEQLNAKLKQTQAEIKRTQSLGQSGGIGGQLRSGLGQGLSQIPGIGGFLAGAGSAGPIGAAALAVGAALGKAANLSLDFNTALGKINTTALLTKPQLRDLGDSILALSAGSTTGPAEAAIAYEKIISATGDVKLSLDILKASLKGAEAGFADVNVVADSIVSTFNSLAPGTATPFQILESLLATKRVGKGEFNDIAANITSVASEAKRVKAPLAEMGGAFALLTSSGFSAEESAVRLGGVYREIGDPKTVAAFKAIGVNVFDQQGKYSGLVAIAGQLRSVLAGLSDEQRAATLSSLGLDSRSAAGLSQLTDSYEKLKESIEQVRNSQGETNRAIEAGATSTKVWQNLWSSTQTEMLKWGNDLLPLLDDIGVAFATLGPILKPVFDIFRGILFTAYQLVRALLAVGGTLVGLAEWKSTGSTYTLDKSLASFGNIWADNKRFAADIKAGYSSDSDPLGPNSGKAPAIAGFKPTGAATGAAPSGSMAAALGIKGSGKTVADSGTGQSAGGGVNMPVTLNIVQNFSGALRQSAQEAGDAVIDALMSRLRDSQIILAR